MGEKSGEPHLKSYLDVEWTLIYDEEKGNLLILAKSEGEGRLQFGKMFNYGYVRKLEYEDNDSSNIVFNLDSLVGARRVKLNEHNLFIDSCHPKALKKDVQTKNKLIVALRPYIKGELMVSQQPHHQSLPRNRNLNTRNIRKGSNQKMTRQKSSSLLKTKMKKWSSR